MTCIEGLESTYSIADDTGMVETWDIAAQTLIVSHQVCKVEITSMCIEHTRSFIYLGCIDGIVRVALYESLHAVLSFSGHLGPVLTVNATFDSKMLVSSGLDCSVKIWNIKERTIIHSFDQRSSAITHAFIDEDNEIIITIGNQGYFAAFGL